MVTRYLAGDGAYGSRPGGRTFACGLTPIPAADAGRAPATAKWQGRFRSDKRGRAEATADVFRGVRSRVRISEDEVKEVKEVEWELADLRRQRSEVWSLRGQGPKRRKRWAVVQDDDAGSGSDTGT